MKPTRSILSREFKYTNADHTSLAKTFARIRAERAMEAEAALMKRVEDEQRWAAHLRYEVEELPSPANVTELRKAKP